MSYIGTILYSRPPHGSAKTQIENIVMLYSAGNAVIVCLAQVWIFGDVWCSIWLAVDVWMCTASILNLCAISLDRYVAVTRPVTYPSIMSSGRAKLLIAGNCCRSQATRRMAAFCAVATCSELNQSASVSLCYCFCTLSFAAFVTY